MKSSRDFFAKMEWEGGLHALMDYGGPDLVDDYDLPEGYVNAWKRSFVVWSDGGVLTDEEWEILARGEAQ